MYLEVLAPLAGGFRVALVILAIAVLFARAPRAWQLIAISAFSYSPAHAAWLLGHPLPRVISTTLDAVCSAVACAAFILAIAEGGAARGLSAERVTRGKLANVAVVGIAVLAALYFRR